MLKIALTFCLILFAKTSFAEIDFLSKYGTNGWVNIYSNNEENDYYNLNAKIKQGDYAQIVELRDFAVEQMDGGRFLYKSKFHLYEFECTTRRFKVIYTQTRAGNLGKGKAIYEDRIPTPTYKEIADNSSVKKLLQIACLDN